MVPDVTGWTRNTADFTMGTHDSRTAGAEWITFAADEPLTGTYKVGSLTIRCESATEHSTALDFVVGDANSSRLFDEWGSDVRATWQDGLFSCTTGTCRMCSTP